MKKGKAFTLIELLVVVSIIALLVSILMPALGRARNQAKMVMCQSNLHQWAIMWGMYARDHNDKFFPWGCSIGQGSWVGILRGLYGDGKTNEGEIRFCPSATRFAANRTDIPQETLARHGVTSERSHTAYWLSDNGADKNWLEGDYGSYGVNNYCYNPPASSGYGTLGGRDHRNYWGGPHVSGANEAPLMGDATFKGGWGEHWQLPPEQEEVAQEGTYPMQRFVIDRHDCGRVDWLFLDWSVRPVGLRGLWLLKWNRKYDTHYAKDNVAWSQFPWIAGFSFEH